MAQFVADGVEATQMLLTPLAYIIKRNIKGCNLALLGRGEWRLAIAQLRRGFESVCGPLSGQKLLCWWELEPGWASSEELGCVRHMRHPIQSVRTASLWHVLDSETWCFTVKGR